MNLFSRLGDKAGTLGSVVSAMGCGMCFPALASVGAAVGLGFLTAWERLFITTLIPLFALLALVANILAWRQHRRPYRGVLSVLGPLLVLVGVVPFIFRAGQYAFYAQLAFYPGVVLMIVSSVWGVVRPPARRCAVPASVVRAHK